MTYEDYADLAAEMNILLRYIDDELVEKIPQKIIEFFQDIASPHFKSRIDPRLPLDQQLLLPSTECMLTLLYRQYWCTNEEREELDELLLAGEEARQQEEQATFDNIFQKIESNEVEFVHEAENLPVEVKENDIMNKIKAILNAITEMFKKLFNKG